jgi:hypothetical protein
MPNRYEQKRTVLFHITVQMLRLQNKETISKAAKEKCQLTSDVANPSELYQLSQQKP